MRAETSKALRSFVVEVLIYAVTVTAYYFLVLHFLGDWLNNLFHHHRGAYAALALGLIVGQGLLLDILTQFLLGLFRNGTEAE